MIQKLISLSLRNRYLVLLIVLVLFVLGVFSVKSTPIDAIPDLSENQVIIYTGWTGQSPQLIEDQVTFPLVSNLQGIPEVKNIRATSMFGASFIYLIFDDNTDIYWARARALERLNYAKNFLPQGLNPVLGPDGTGVGHILWYTLDAPQMNLGEQRALQDWYVKLALQSIQGVAEVASFGGFEKQYELVVNPMKLQYYGISLSQVIEKVKANNNDAGGRKFEMNDMSYIIRGLGYVKSKTDLEKIRIITIDNIPITVKDIATVQFGSEERFGIFDKNGNGEAVGGIVVMRYGENADNLIRKIKAKMNDLEKGFPSGVHFSIDYDRSSLIEAAISNIKDKLVEEIVVVSLVVLLFMFHWKSALSIVIQIPITIAISFVLLNIFGISSNIMSLTGIALAIGVIVDNSIIMSENAHRNLSNWQSKNNK